MRPAAPVRPFVRREPDGEALWFLGNLVTLKATGAETRGQLTVAEFVNPAGFAPPLHRHLREDELFYVVSGTATFQPDAAPLDPVALGHAAARHAIEILGPPPS